MGRSNGEQVLESRDRMAYVCTMGEMLRGELMASLNHTMNILKTYLLIRNLSNYVISRSKFEPHNLI